MAKRTKKFINKKRSLAMRAMWKKRRDKLHNKYLNESPIKQVNLGEIRENLQDENKSLYNRLNRLEKVKRLSWNLARIIKLAGEVLEDINSHD